MKAFLLATACLGGSFLTASAFAGQAPDAASARDVPLSSRGRVYAAEQFSNTVSVTDLASKALLGVIRLGEPQPGNLSPLYRGRVLVHGMGFSPDRKTMSAAPRTRPSSPPTAARFGSPCAARITSPCWTAAPSRRRPASRCRQGRA